MRLNYPSLITKTVNYQFVLLLFKIRHLAWMFYLSRRKEIVICIAIYPQKLVKNHSFLDFNRILWTWKWRLLNLWIMRMQIAFLSPISPTLIILNSWKLLGISLLWHEKRILFKIFITKWHFLYERRKNRNLNLCI